MRKGMKVPEEVKRRMVATRRINGSYNFSAEARRNMGLAHRGLKRTEEFKRKIGDIHRGKIISKESIKKMVSTRRKLGSYDTSWCKGKSFRKEKYCTPRILVNGKLRFMSHVVWCKYNNIHRVPDGCIIHHLDFNPKNNSPENLQLLELGYHSSSHNRIMKEVY